MASHRDAASLGPRGLPDRLARRPRLLPGGRRRARPRWSSRTSAARPRRPAGCRSREVAALGRGRADRGHRRGAAEGATNRRASEDQTGRRVRDLPRRGRPGAARPQLGRQRVPRAVDAARRRRRAGRAPRRRGGPRVRRGDRPSWYAWTALRAVTADVSRLPGGDLEHTDRIVYDVTAVGGTPARRDRRHHRPGRLGRPGRAGGLAADAVHRPAARRPAGLADAAGDHRTSRSPGPSGCSASARTRRPPTRPGASCSTRIADGYPGAGRWHLPGRRHRPRRDARAGARPRTVRGDVAARPGDRAAGRLAPIRPGRRRARKGCRSTGTSSGSSSGSRWTSRPNRW